MPSIHFCWNGTENGNRLKPEAFDVVDWRNDMIGPDLELTNFVVSVCMASRIKSV